MTFKVIRDQGQGQEMTSIPYRDYFLVNAVDLAAGRASSLSKTEWLGVGMVICLGQGADLHMA